MNTKLQNIVASKAIEALNELGGDGGIVDVSVSSTYMDGKEIVTEKVTMELIQLNTGEYVVEEITHSKATDARWSGRSM